MANLTTAEFARLAVARMEVLLRDVAREVVNDMLDKVIREAINDAISEDNEPPRRRMNTDDDLLSAKEMASYIGISEVTFRNRKYPDILPSVTVGRLKKYPRRRAMMFLINMTNSDSQQ